MRDTRHQLAHAIGAVLRFLHAQDDQVEGGRIDTVGRRGGQVARQPARIYLDQPFDAAHRERDADALAGDQVGRATGADQSHGVPRHQQAGGKQGTVRGSEDQDAAGHGCPPSAVRLADVRGRGTDGQQARTGADCWQASPCEDSNRNFTLWISQQAKSAQQTSQCGFR